MEDAGHGSKDLALFHALRLRGGIDRAALEERLRTATSRGVPLEEVLRGAVAADALQRAIAVRDRQARRCGACGDTTYLLPGQSILTRACEGCGGELLRTGAPLIVKRARRAPPTPGLRRWVHRPAPERAVAVVAPWRRTRWALLCVLVAGLATLAASLLVRPGRDVTSVAAISSGVAGQVLLPSGASTALEALVVSWPGVEPVAVDASGRFFMARPERAVELAAWLGPTRYLLANVGPEDASVSLSAQSTAVALSLRPFAKEGLGSEELLRLRALALEEPAVLELGAFLDSALSTDPTAIETDFPGLDHKRLWAVERLEARHRPRR